MTCQLHNNIETNHSGESENLSNVDVNSSDFGKNFHVSYPAINLASETQSADILTDTVCKNLKVSDGDDNEKVVKYKIS